MKIYLDQNYGKKQPGQAESQNDLGVYQLMLDVVKAVSPYKNDVQLDPSVHSEENHTVYLGRSGSCTVTPIKGYNGATIGFVYTYPANTRNNLIQFYNNDCVFWVKNGRQFPTNLSNVHVDEQQIKSICEGDDSGGVVKIFRQKGTNTVQKVTRQEKDIQYTDSYYYHPNQISLQRQTLQCPAKRPSVMQTSLGVHGQTVLMRLKSLRQQRQQTKPDQNGMRYFFWDNHFWAYGPIRDAQGQCLGFAYRKSLRPTAGKDNVLGPFDYYIQLAGRPERVFYATNERDLFSKEDCDKLDEICWTTNGVLQVFLSKNQNLPSANQNLPSAVRITMDGIYSTEYYDERGNVSNCEISAPLTSQYVIRAFYKPDEEKTSSFELVKLHTKPLKCTKVDVFGAPVEVWKLNLSFLQNLGWQALKQPGQTVLPQLLMPRPVVQSAHVANQPQYQAQPRIQPYQNLYVQPYQNPYQPRVFYQNPYQPQVLYQNPYQPQVLYQNPYQPQVLYQNPYQPRVQHLYVQPYANPHQRR